MIFHMFNKLFTNYNKLEDVNGIKLNKYQLATLKAYKINIEGKTVKQLLKDINDEQGYHVDQKGLPSDEHYDILESLYWDIQKQNKRH